MEYYAYIVKCADGTFYSGYTNDLQHRISVHNNGKGAKYTRSRLPVKLIYHETFSTKSEAMKREVALKRLSHTQKELLILNSVRNI